MKQENNVRQVRLSRRTLLILPWPARLLHAGRIIPGMSWGRTIRNHSPDDR